MGRQVCFYITQFDVDDLIKVIYNKNGIIIDSTGKKLNENELKLMTDSNYYQKHFNSNKFFITKQELFLKYNFENNQKHINEIVSEVIEFSLCTPIPKKIVDTSIVYNDFKRYGFTVINDADKFHEQMKELMNNPTFIDNPNYCQNGFENGRLWYSQEYYNDEWQKVNKSKELTELFNSLKNYITKKYKLSKDKFAYIGPNAYDEYICGQFIPCCGKNKIFF